MANLPSALAEQLAGGEVPDNDDRVPALLAVSDNGPQMRADKTAQFMAVARIAQHFGRPGTPNSQAWIESFFGHLKTEHPHLDTIEDPAALRAELDVRKELYYTPDDPPLGNPDPPARHPLQCGPSRVVGVRGGIERWASDGDESD